MWGRVDRLSGQSLYHRGHVQLYHAETSSCALLEDSGVPSRGRKSEHTFQHKRKQTGIYTQLQISLQILKTLDIFTSEDVQWWDSQLKIYRLEFMTIEDRVCHVFVLNLEGRQTSVVLLTLKNWGSSEVVVCRGSSEYIIAEVTLT